MHQTINGRFGPASQLTHVDLPGVGNYLQDHALLAMDYAGVPRASAEKILGARLTKNICNHKQGRPPSDSRRAALFVKTRPDLDIPDMKLYIAPGEDAVAEADFGIYLSILCPKESG